MKAVGFKESLPVEVANALEDIELGTPIPRDQDLFVEVQAVSVNPVDTKIRMRGGPETGHKVLGFDAAGVVKGLGAGVSKYKLGDEVFYAGDAARQGTNAQFHVVDERIVGRKPSKLSMADAAALPLTSITAWEILFDSFKLQEGAGQGDTLLVIGGAGGVGSILIQIAKAATKLRVVATASRPETIEWCKKMGADHVIDHRDDLTEQLDALGIAPRYVASLTATEQHFDAIVDVIEPRGEICVIDDPVDLNIMKIKQKSLSFHVEFMFARPIFQMDDIDSQRAMLNRIADLVDAGEIITTATRHLGSINAANLIEAHRLQESGSVYGKTVLEDFE
ncbi:zinc-binding alcohol dehydrogenase family protein [Shimia sp.]|uniref:zinc-binding alcohol dehydrogenase family protein n=1 Tax=Shimia sp. TaxID=1954381 RepID=UPI003BAD3C83